MKNASHQILESKAVVQKATNGREDTVIQLKVAAEQPSANMCLKKF